MSVPAPHFFLDAEAVPSRASAAATTAVEPSHQIGEWRFTLRLPSGETSLAAGDTEDEATAERLELLAIVRGLEALDQPSRVTLVTTPNIERGLKYGLAQWRECDWQWERFGRMMPVKNADLWQRLDRLSGIHSLACRPKRLERADDLAAPPCVAIDSGRRLRIDESHSGPKAPNQTRQTPSQQAASPAAHSRCADNVFDFLRTALLRLGSLALQR